MRSGMFTSSGLNLGMRRMTAFPYDMLRKTSEAARTVTGRKTKPKSPEAQSPKTG